MKVKRYDYVNQLGPGLATLLRDIERMLQNGSYVLSSEVSEFEIAFARFNESKHVCGVNSGTDALILALHALDIGPGDEVITQANTFHATVAAICQVGATPVLVDAQPDSFLMNVDQIASVMTDSTKAIIPVHLFGKPTPMRELLVLAEKHGVYVVEDAAQAHGARLYGRRVGTFGTIGCFSFHPSKNLAAAGDAGAICTDDATLRERLDVLRSLGQSGQNHHICVGLNSKLDAIQARVLSEKLPRLDSWNAQRRDIATKYRNRLANLDLQFQSFDETEEHVYHLFQIRTSSRNGLLQHLNENGVDAVVRYPTPIHLQPAFSNQKWKPGQFPVAEALANELVCLPIRPSMSDAEIDYVTDQVRRFMGSE